MRIINRAVLLLVAVLLVLFAVSNRATVQIGLWPLPFLAVAPLYLLCFLSALIGVLCGAAVAWFTGRSTRRELKDCRGRIAALERELAATQSQLEGRGAAPGNVSRLGES